MLIILAALAVFAAISIWRPWAGVGLVLALAPTYLFRFDVLGIPMTFLECLILVFLAVRIPSIRSVKKIKQLKWLNLAIGLFVLAGIISVLVSPEKLKALGQLKTFIIEPILFFYALYLLSKSQEEFRTPLKFLFFSASAISVFGIFQYFSLMALPMRFWGGGGLERIVSVFEYPNALALYLGPAIALFIVLAIKNEWLFSKFWFGIGLALQILALIMTFSRGAWAAVAVVVFFSLFLRFKPKKLVAATAIILIVFLLVPIIRNRLVETVNDPSGLARADLLKAGLSEVSKQPILGNGLYGFRTTLTDRNFQGEILNYPHNIILNFWLETGLLGLLSFLFIVFVSMKGQRGRIYGMAGIAFLCVVLIHGLVDVPYFKNDLSLLFWSVAAMLNAKN